MSSTIIITGASSGIGREISTRLLGRGHKVYGIGRNHEKLNAIQVESGDTFHPIVCDVRDREQIARACQEILSNSGNVDILINNAGVLRIQETHRVSDLDLDDQFDTIAVATFLFTRAFLPRMIEQARGLIINMGSVSGVKASPKMAIYGAAKAAVVNFTKSLAIEYADKGIRTVCICPGTVQTELMDKMMLGLIQKKVPMKRVAQTSEIASLVEYLISPDASYITGATITIDGGVSL